MGIPTSKVGYTSATTRRETTKSIMDMLWHWKTTNYNINCGKNKRLHRSWLKIPGVFTFYVRIDNTLTYAQALCVITDLEHGIFKARTALVKFRKSFSPCMIERIWPSTLHVTQAVLPAPSSYCATSLGTPRSFLNFLLLMYWQFISGAVLLLHPSFCCIPWFWPTKKLTPLLCPCSLVNLLFSYISLRNVMPGHTHKTWIRRGVSGLSKNETGRCGLTSSKNVHYAEEYKQNTISIFR
jgi:hypothetical protein